jgi:hypothetical protein
MSQGGRVEERLRAIREIDFGFPLEDGSLVARVPIREMGDRPRCFRKSG